MSYLFVLILIFLSNPSRVPAQPDAVQVRKVETSQGTEWRYGQRPPRKRL